MIFRIFRVSKFSKFLQISFLGWIFIEYIAQSCIRMAHRLFSADFEAVLIEFCFEVADSSGPGGNLAFGLSSNASVCHRSDQRLAIAG